MRLLPFFFILICSTLFVRVLALSTRAVLLRVHTDRCFVAFFVAVWDSMVRCVGSIDGCSLFLDVSLTLIRLVDSAVTRFQDLER
jgi:hypothetical protein